MSSSHRRLEAENRDFGLAAQRERILDSDFSRNEKLVFLCLAHDYHAKGIAISERAISRRTSMHRATVRRALASLEARGAMFRKPGRGTAPTMYFVHFKFDDERAKKKVSMQATSQNFRRLAGWDAAQERRQAARDKKASAARQAARAARSLDHKGLDAWWPVDDDGRSPFALDDPEPSNLDESRSPF